MCSFCCKCMYDNCKAILKNMFSNLVIKHITVSMVYLGAACIQTLDQLVPALGEAVQSRLQFAGHLFVLDTGQQVLAHGAQLVHGGTLDLQVCLDRLEMHEHINNTLWAYLGTRACWGSFKVPLHSLISRNFQRPPPGATEPHWEWELILGNMFSFPPSIFWLSFPLISLVSRDFHRPLHDVSEPIQEWELIVGQNLSKFPFILWFPGISKDPHIVPLSLARNTSSFWGNNF